MSHGPEKCFHLEASPTADKHKAPCASSTQTPLRCFCPFSSHSGGQEGGCVKTRATPRRHYTFLEEKVVSEERGQLMSLPPSQRGTKGVERQSQDSHLPNNNREYIFFLCFF